MKNPLRKRLPRELKGELGKYLVVFILMVASIGFVSGFLVADNSMLIAYNEGFEKYNIEDGNFRTAEQVHKTQREEIEALGVKLYDNYYVEEPLDNGSTMRFFKNRQQVDKVCLMHGNISFLAKYGFQHLYNAGFIIDNEYFLQTHSSASFPDMIISII